VFVRGNGDRQPDAWALETVDDERLAIVAAWSDRVELDVEGLGAVLFCHGSPRSDEEIITAASPPERVRPMLAAVAGAVVVCGHTHVQFDRRVAGARVINAGSVGMPYEGRAGAFWLLVTDGEPELRHTAYNVEAAGAALRASGFPDVDDLIRESLVEPVDAAFVARHFEDQAST
jgi:predicted phosphodiesterase